MQRWLRTAGTIQQCTRCYSLRDMDDPFCPTCLRLLGELRNEVQPLSLNDVEDDTLADYKFFIFGDAHIHC